MLLLSPLPCCDRPPASHRAPGRRGTFPVCSNRSNMFFDLRFVPVYAFAVVVVVLGASDRVLAAAPRQFDRSPVHTTHLIALVLLPYAQIVRICPLTFASYREMHFLLWLLWFVATFEEEGESWLRPSLQASGLRLRAVCSNGRPHFPRHLVVLPPFPHAQFTPVCPPTVVSYSSISLLVWLLWFVATFEVQASGLRPRRLKSGLFERSPSFPTASGRRTTFPVCSIHSSMPTDLWFVFGYVFAAMVVVVWYDFREGRRVGCARGFRIAPTRSPQRTWSPWHISRMRKSFEYALGVKFHVQI
jgi:hypothetical protein